MRELILIFSIFLICIGLYIITSKETFLNPTTKVILFYNNTINLDSRDPFVQIHARKSLNESFSIKSAGDIHVCTSDSCIQTFIIPSQTQYTLGLLNENSVFTFSKPDQSENVHEITEYFPSFSTLQFRVTVATNFIIGKKYTFNDLKLAIEQGKMSVWFLNTLLETKENFKIMVNGVFMPWSPNDTTPDVICTSCDTIQIMPR